MQKCDDDQVPEEHKKRAWARRWRELSPKLESGITTRRNKGCKISPGDPASSPLDQWEEHSAKIVFENPHERALFDVCLDHPSLQGMPGGGGGIKVPRLHPISSFTCAFWMLAAAANASSHASTSALTTATAAPAASPFAQLLRSSRFATFDPQIRKTYYSPQQFVERGYWGLKRPIAQRKKNSFITIKQWEARQHYIEWDNAEDQVRFIRRVEELNVRPGAQENTKWTKQLGPAKNTCLMDSEFSPHAWKTPTEAEAEDAESTEQYVLEPPQHIRIDDLGRRGPGGYGKDATRNVTAVSDILGQDGKPQYRRSPTGVLPNVASMSPAEFQRYLEKLRRIRPAFKQYIAREEERQKREREQRDLRAEQSKEAVAHSLVPPVAGKSLLQIAQNPDSTHHLFFIAEHTQSEYRSTDRIQPQPHRNGALMYTHPSDLDSLFHNKRKPGIILDDAANSRFDQIDKVEYIVAFAGFAARIEGSEVEARGKMALMDPGAKVDNWPRAIAEMRPISRSAMGVVQVPRVVGRDPDEGLNRVIVQLHVTMDRGFDNPRRKNPHIPGSRDYVAHEGLDNPREGASRGAKTPTTAPLSSLKNPPKQLDSPSTFPMYRPQTNQELATNLMAIERLTNMLDTQNDGKPRDDEM
ncbi:hypothetical protein B0H12DRAFT_1263373 [Mycena haematopus]|nr:hypothetical protein B0H12DRAFT_1263373 [Mycena haematopus]